MATPDAPPLDMFPGTLSDTAQGSVIAPLAHEPGAVREVGAAVLVNTYWHVHIAELVLSGATPREASEACWKTYYFSPIGMQTYMRAVIGTASVRAAFAGGDALTRDYASFLVEQAQYPGGDSRKPTDPLTPVPERGPHRHWTTRCLRAGVGEDRRLLTVGWAEHVREHGWCPRARIADEDAARLDWLLAMMWLLATGGGTLLHCARVAHDRASGRPARKRQPADPDWLAAELDAGLTACWDAIVSADDGYGGPLWRPMPPTGGRPVADSAAPDLERRWAAEQPSQVVSAAAGLPPVVMHGKSHGATESPSRAPRRNRRRR